MKNNSKTGRMAGIAVLIAMVFILQMAAGFITIGSFPLTLVLVPIVVGASIYGAGAGAVLGFAFGVIVLINCINGLDLGGNALWMINPFYTAVICLLKGTLAGYAAGVSYSALSKKNTYAGLVLAAIICPVVNTGAFIVLMFALFGDTLSAWAGGTPLLSFVILGLAGANFLIETALNVVLCPGVLSIINVVKKL